ncbi:lysozyme [Taishania pollutisoli]|uniref:lysozyme n=1 Tax=Taishania pollutisoli TaxID=2766479 RepID=UPI001C1E5B72|nr:lysozyme [Taishania pollutisoli]
MTTDYTSPPRSRGSAGTAYRATPSEKYFTIGYGHNGADVKEGQKITEGQGLLLLHKDMAKAVAAVDAVAHPSLNQSQFDAVCDLVYNAGAGAIAVSTGTGQALRKGDASTLRNKLTQFHYQNGKSLLGLRRRAAGRVALFDGMLWQQAEAVGRAAK